MPRRAAPLCLIAVLMLPAIASIAATDPGPVVAQRGGVSLTAGGVRDLLAALDADTQAKLRADPQALATFVRDRLLQAALLDEARAAKWDQRPDVAARAEQARNTAIAESYLASNAQPEAGFPTEQDVQAAYEANKAKLLVPRQYHLAQIFIAVPAGAPKAVDDEAQDRIASLRQQWLKAKGDPATVIKKAADDKRQAATASDLGWVREDQVAAAIRPTVAGMNEGAIADPVRMADGWHVVRMNETKPAAPASLPEVRDAIVRALRQAKQQQNARAYLDGLLQRAPIQLNEIELARIVGK